VIINPSQIKTEKGTGGCDYKRLGRNYEWGFVDSLDPNNSDFTRLHKLVLKYIRKELEKTM
jgi:septin family protein